MDGRGTEERRADVLISVPPDHLLFLHVHAQKLIIVLPEKSKRRVKGYGSGHIRARIDFCSLPACPAFHKVEVSVAPAENRLAFVKARRPVDVTLCLERPESLARPGIHGMQISVITAEEYDRILPFRGNEGICRAHDLVFRFIAPQRIPAHCIQSVKHSIDGACINPAFKKQGCRLYRIPGLELPFQFSAYPVQCIDKTIIRTDVYISVSCNRGRCNPVACLEGPEKNRLIRDTALSHA